MGRFKPPIEERDKRIMAREFFLKNSTEEEVVKSTELPPATVHRIHEWITGAYGIAWTQQRHPELELRDGRWIVKQTVQPNAPPAEGPLQEGLEEGMSQGGLSEESPPASPAAPASQTEKMKLPELPAGMRYVIVERTSDDAAQTTVRSGSGQELILEEERESFESGPATGKRNNAFLTPKTILFFDYMRGRGMKAELPIFLEECVEGYFKGKYGLALAFVQGGRSWEK